MRFISNRTAEGAGNYLATIPAGIFMIVSAKKHIGKLNSKFDKDFAFLITFPEAFAKGLIY